jgi:hypothetical protein
MYKEIQEGKATQKGQTETWGESTNTEILRRVVGRWKEKSRKRPENEHK